MSRSFHKKVTYNLIAQVFGKGISILIAFFTLSLMARYLGEVGMGQYGTIIKFVGIFGLIADFGLNVVTTRELSKPGTDEEKVLGNSFALRFCLSLGVLACAPLIATLFPYDWEVVVGIFLAMFSFYFVLWTGILNSVLQKNVRTDKIVLADIAVKTGTFLGALYVIHAGLGLHGFVVALICGSGLGFFVAWYLASHYLRLRMRFEWDYWQELVGHAYPIAITNFFIMIYFNIDTIFLSVLRGSYDTGIYHLSYRVLETLANFAYSFSMLFIPFFTEHVAARNVEKFVHYFKQAVKYILLLALPVVLGGIFLAPWVIQILAKDGFQESILVLQILSGAIFFVFLNSLMHNTLAVIHQQKKAIGIYAFGAIFNMVTNYIFIPKYSYYAAAVTTIISEGIIFVGTTYLLLQWVKRSR